MGYEEKNGFSAKMVESLYERYRRLGLSEGFGSFDDFLCFAEEQGCKPHQQLRRYDKSRPHSRENSYFYGAGMAEKDPRKETIVSPYCAGCTKVCTDAAHGCVPWQRYFVQNWNAHICARKMPVKKPPEREVWQYAHPDRIREGGHGD